MKVFTHYIYFLTLVIGQLIFPHFANASILENSLGKLGVLSSINKGGVVNDQLGGI